MVIVKVSCAVLILVELSAYVKSCLRSGNDRNTFSFASYYGDHMVLQRGPRQSIVWGYGPSPGSNVTVYLSGKTPLTVVVDRGNIWKAKLAVVTDTKPHTITAISSAGTIMLEDVLFGDVWICSGQSNMQFTMSMVNNASAELADAVNYPNIRVFTVAMETSEVPLSDLKSVEQTWSIPNNDTIGGKDWTYFSSVCWLYGKRLYRHLKYPIGLVASTWGGTAVEVWSDPDVLKKCKIPVADTVKEYQPVPTEHSVLWNAMMYPLTNMTIYGAIWYQGEANFLKPNTYNCTFPEMISSWRSHFYVNSEMQTDQTFPFGFVQLSAWRNNSGITTGFPDIRWHQTADYGYVPNSKMPNVFMAVAMDLPDYTSPYGSIHPRDKQDVADRLVLSGLSVGYSIDVGKYKGAFPSRYFVDRKGKTFLITYDYDSAEIDVRSTQGFDVCCSENKQTQCSSSDSTWVAAPIVDHDKQTVTISFAGCASPYVVAIRYAWRESPCPFKKCAIYSVENNLPAPPFMQQIAQPSDKLYFHNDKYKEAELIQTRIRS